MLNAIETAYLLEIEVNHLHQLQHRKQLTWVEKKGKFTYYRLEDVEAYKAKREKSRKK